MRQNGTILVVGAGLSGATHARVLAEAGRRVHVIDRRPQVAGNAFDEIDATGVRRHAYGPHLFHTNSDRVMAWLSRFAEFVPYEHRVTARLPNGGFAPLPVGRGTINAVFGLELAGEQEVREFLARVVVPHAAPTTAAEHLHSRIGVELTDLLFRPYTRKMWGMDLEEMDAAVVRRIPIRHDDETRYFPTDRHQGLPRSGYADLVLRILDHPLVRVDTGVEFRASMLGDHAYCFNSMAIDEYYDYVHGPLPYRSIRFRHEAVPADRRTGPTAQVNFTDDSPFTRHCDWALLPGHVVRATGRKTVTTEEPCDYRDNALERYYPVPDVDGRNAALYAKYRALANQETRLQFIGRCGTYRYLNMDQVVGQALRSASMWLAGVPAPAEGDLVP